MKSIKEIRERISKNVKDSEHEYLGIVCLLGKKYLKFKCSDCGNTFIMSVLNASSEILCSNCEFEFPNKYGNQDLWTENIRVPWVFNKLFEVHGEKYTQVSEYKGRLEKIEFQCSECGNIFSSLPGNIFKGRGCPKCVGKHRHTAEEYKKEIESIHGDNIELLTEYTRANKKLLVKCNTCGYRWSTSSNSLRRRGCPNCSLLSKGEKIRIPKDVALEKLNSVHGNKIELISEYKGVRAESLFRCTDCGYEWTSCLTHVYKISKCLVCSDKERAFNNRLSEEEFLNRVFEQHGDRYTVLGKYIDTKTRVTVKCNNCGNIWEARSTGIMYGQGCPKCNRGVKEESLREFVSSLGFSCENKWFFIDNKRYEIDIFIEELNIGIEFDGLYWHSEDKKGRNYHKDKQELFKSIGIRLVHVREDEWEYKKDIVSSRIQNILGVTDIRIYARKCEIRSVSREIKNEFLERYHIQGKDKAEFSFGLYYNNRLISVMTFGRVRISLKSSNDTDGTYELLRFSNRTNLSVVGGFSKLLKHAEKVLKDIGVRTIKTFADKRWSVGNVYSRNGFTLERESSPNYIYHRRMEVLSRYQCQKHKLHSLLDDFDDNLSEVENMRNHGYSRVFDCGNLVFYKSLN